MNEDSICNSVISVPSVANGFWLRLRRAVPSVAEAFEIFVLIIQSLLFLTKRLIFLERLE